MVVQSKIHPNLSPRLHLHALGPSNQPLRVIVKFRQGTLGEAVAALGIETTFHTFQLISASAHLVLPSVVDALSRRDDVEMIWYDEPVHTMLDQSAPLIGAPFVWQQGVTGKGIKVGIVDTGIDPNHPDFAGRVALMRDYTGQGPDDNNGHGTHVAGIVGGSGAAGGGRYKGIAPECLFFTAKALRGDGSGTTSDVMAGVEWAVQQNVQVINLSLGSDGACDGTDALSETCDAAVSRGIAVCIAAGNAGPAASTVGSPGCARSVITVGATSKTDQIASFSSRGPTSDNRVKPDICFPGVDIASCRASGTSLGSPIDNYYTRASGTSMATPHAAGACALLLQARPGLSPLQVKDLLAATAKNLNLDPDTQGAGRAQVFQAYQQSMGTEPAPMPTPGPTPAPVPSQGSILGAGGCFNLLKNMFRRR